MTDKAWEEMLKNLPPNAALMADGSVKYCGVLVRPGQADKPCVLTPGHEGGCVYRKR